MTLSYLYHTHPHHTPTPPPPTTTTTTTTTTTHNAHNTQHTQPTHTPQGVSLKQVDPCALNCCGTPAVAMSERGAAVRRRERRLRAWHRMTVAMELATAFHHSAQRVEAPREGVEGETNDAPRRPKPPLPGKRPAPLDEVAEPQAKLGAAQWHRL